MTRDSHLVSLRLILAPLRHEVEVVYLGYFFGGLQRSWYVLTVHPTFDEEVKSLPLAYFRLLILLPNVALVDNSLQVQ